MCMYVCMQGNLLEINTVQEIVSCGGLWEGNDKFEAGKLSSFYCKAFQIACFIFFNFVHVFLFHLKIFINKSILESYICTKKIMDL